MPTEPVSVGWFGLYVASVFVALEHVDTSRALVLPSEVRYYTRERRLHTLKGAYVSPVVIFVLLFGAATEQFHVGLVAVGAVLLGDLALVHWHLARANARIEEAGIGLSEAELAALFDNWVRATCWHLALTILSGVIWTLADSASARFID
jgi:hypothetical protein